MPVVGLVYVKVRARACVCVCVCVSIHYLVFGEDFFDVTILSESPSLPLSNFVLNP